MNDNNLIEFSNLFLEELANLNISYEYLDLGESWTYCFYLPRMKVIELYGEPFREPVIRIPNYDKSTYLEFWYGNEMNLLEMIKKQSGMRITNE